MAILQLLKAFLFASIFFIFILVLISKKQERKRSKSANLPPSPPKLPIIGNLHQLRNMPHLSLQKLSRKFGPIISLQLGQIPSIVVSSSKLAKEVLKTHDLVLSNRPKIFSARHLFYDCTDIAFAPYSPYWRHMRKICILELLSTKRVQSFSFVRDEEVARLVSRITESYPGTINLSKMLGIYSNTILCRVAFGKDFSLQGDYDKLGFQHLLEEYQELLGGFSVGDFFPSMEFIHSLTGMKSRLKNAFKRFDTLFDRIVEEHLHDQNRRKEEHRMDLVDVLLDVQRNGSKNDLPLTMDNIKAIILDMFAAGTDTTFIVLDWVMIELIMNPEVMERAQSEVRRTVGERRVVTENDLLQMNYLKAVIKEVLRLHPPVPILLARESMEDVTIYGYNIPAKTRFFVNVWAIGRDPESWENPDKFYPERFMDSSIDFKGQDFELIPFGAGRRMCPALMFGTASLELAIAQLLHSFDWALPPGISVKDLDMTEVFGVTMHRKEGMVAVAKPHFG